MKPQIYVTAVKDKLYGIFRREIMLTLPQGGLTVFDYDVAGDC